MYLLPVFRFLNTALTRFQVTLEQRTCLYVADAASQRCSTVAQRHRGDVIMTSSRPLYSPAVVAWRPNSLSDPALSVTSSAASSWPHPGSLVFTLPCLVLVITRFSCHQRRSSRQQRMRSRY